MSALELLYEENDEKKRVTEKVSDDSSHADAVISTEDVLWR